MRSNKLVIGILAHVDAGKTTLAEGLLYTGGRIRKLGRVDHGDAFLDNFSLERERGITIFSKQAQIQWEGLDITLLDTPGHVDFSAEMERTLQVLDYALLVISGSDGVQGHVQTLWKLLGQHRIPTFLFVNKMDHPDAMRNQNSRGTTSGLQYPLPALPLPDTLSPDILPIIVRRTERSPPRILPPFLPLPVRIPDIRRPALPAVPPAAFPYPYPAGPSC